VIVGVTKPVLTTDSHCDEAPHRTASLSNPLYYFERVRCIELSMIENGIPCDRYRISPFPIDEPHLLLNYLDASVPVLTTACDSWNDAKRAKIESAGYHVECMYENPNPTIRGSEIRQSILSGSTEWEKHVFPKVKEYLVEINFPLRLRNLSSAS
jgi:nicotinamide mononucleotide adenylyltransferase